MADGLQVPAGAGVTGNAQVDAQANGIVKVTAQAYTLSGTPVGEPMPIEVKATQAGTIGWLIAIAAGIVLVGSSALRIHQVTKERAKASAGGSAGVSDTPGGSEDSAGQSGVPPHPAQVVPPASQTDHSTDHRDQPRDPESLDV